MDRYPAALRSLFNRFKKRRSLMSESSEQRILPRQEKDCFLGGWPAGASAAEQTFYDMGAMYDWPDPAYEAEQHWFEEMQLSTPASFGPAPPAPLDAQRGITYEDSVLMAELMRELEHETGTHPGGSLDLDQMKEFILELMTKEGEQELGLDFTDDTESGAPDIAGEQEAFYEQGGMMQEMFYTGMGGAVEEAPDEMMEPSDALDMPEAPFGGMGPSLEDIVNEPMPEQVPEAMEGPFPADPYMMQDEMDEQEMMDPMMDPFGPAPGP